MNSDKNVGKEPGRRISMELTADGARVTNLSLRGSRLVVTIEAELSDSQVEASNAPMPASFEGDPQSETTGTQALECACGSHEHGEHAAELEALAASIGIAPAGNSADAVFSGGHTGHAVNAAAAAHEVSYPHLAMGSETLQPPASAYMPGPSMDPHDPAFGAEHTREIPVSGSVKTPSMDPHDPAFHTEHTREIPAQDSVKAPSMDPHDPAFGLEHRETSRTEERGLRTDLNDTQPIPGMGTARKASETPEEATDNSETQPLDPTALANLSEQQPVPAAQEPIPEDNLKAIFENLPEKDTPRPAVNTATDQNASANTANNEESARFLSGLASFESESQMKSPAPAAGPEDAGPLAIAEESSAMGGERHGEPLPTMSFGMGEPQPQPSSQLSFQDRENNGGGNEGMAGDTGGTTVLIRYTCPKCKTQGMQAVDKVGTVVNCSNCGKAMRLVMKK